MLEAIWYDIFRESSLFVLIIVGLGAAMLLLRFGAFFYVLHVVTAAGRMGKTKNRYLKSVRNAYDKEMLRHEQVDNVGIFVERELSRFGFLGMSVSFVDRLNVQSILLVVCTCFVGMAQGYYEEWDTQTMGLLLLFTLVTFMILITMENLLRLDDVEELLEIRIVDYFENNVKSDILMGERNQQKKERSLLLAKQMEEHMAKLEMAAEQQEPSDEAEAVAAQGEPSLRWEQEEAFMQMLNEFFG